MDPETTAAFERMKEADPGNRRCLECDAPDPQWCSLSYGTFVCLNCSGLHRSLGVHLSFVRSSTMDTWQPQQLKLMEAGGNTKCKNFFSEYGVWDVPFKVRYNTKAAAYYRALLRSSVDSSVSPPPPLNPEEAACKDTSETITPPPSLAGTTPIRSISSAELKRHQQQQQEEEEQDEGFIAALQQQAAAASAAAAAAAASVSNSGALDSALQTVSSFVSNAKELTAKTIEAAGESTLIEKAKGGLQSGSEWIAQQGKKISSTLTGSEDADSSGRSSPLQYQQQQQQKQQQQKHVRESDAGEDPQRSSSGVLQSMMSTAKELTSKSLSSVSQAVRSSSNLTNSEGGVLDRAREGFTSLTAAATGWLQPAEVPPPAYGSAEVMQEGGLSEDPSNYS